MARKAIEVNGTSLESALDYAGRGWPVFPCHTAKDGGCSCLVPSCDSSGKHPRTPNGHKDATVDEARIRSYWERLSDANIGIATGGASGIVVIDVDTGKGGEESLLNLVSANWQLPVTVEVLTGGGGRHIYFKHPGRSIRSTSGRLGPGLDVRGDGGYVVAPPSLHASGRRYEWEASSQPDEVSLAAIPPWLLELLADTRTERQAPASVGADIEDGQRNETLTSLAGSMRHRGMGEAAIVAALIEENAARCTPPLSENEVRTIAGSVSRYAPGVPTTNGHQPMSPTDAEVHNTDLGNARRLVALHGGDIRFNFIENLWLVWDGMRWVPDSDGEVQRRAKNTVAAIYSQASQEAEGEREKLAKHALSSEAKNRIEAMVELAKSEPGIAVSPTMIDSDPWLLNCVNGTLDLRTGTLREHRREDLLTMSTLVPYHPEARLDLWDNFIANIVDADPDFAEYLQRTTGASMSGVLIEFIFFAYGKPWTGKTTFLQAIGNTLGDYCKTADFETFLKRDRIGGPRSDLARLRGARFVKAVEVGDGRQLAEGLLKLITGGDTLTVRDMYSKEFEYQPQFTLWLAANDAPEVRHDDDAFWRRLKRLPFVHEFPVPDETIKAKLTDPEYAGPAILRWAVRGCLAWQQHGLGVPDAVRLSTDEYQQDSDPLIDFLDAQCVLTADATVGARALYMAYRGYVDDSGLRRDEQLTSTKFGGLIAKRFQKKHTRTGKIYQGIGLRGAESQGELSGENRGP